MIQRWGYSFPLAPSTKRPIVVGKVKIHFVGYEQLMNEIKKIHCTGGYEAVYITNSILNDESRKLDLKERFSFHSTINK